MDEIGWSPDYETRIVEPWDWVSLKLRKWGGGCSDPAEQPKLSSVIKCQSRRAEGPSKVTEVTADR